ncbi:hypothetical protein K2173_005283 [Erythroxylum novogranatense]|uniref:Uncharacterized protein n=1 Tax=Erythroxylum novogranatense TaxID=1862640 RepID=A0AAV8TUR9_9ROSI|nr:hypothetical protein K2173_005283 [Erythroxylum novogranatense]
MSGDNFSDRASRAREVLEDLTNRSSRRKFSLITDGVRLKSVDRYGENVGSEQSYNVSQENVAPLCTSEQTEIKEPEFVDDSVELVKYCASRDSCTSSASIVTSSGLCKKGNDNEVVVLASDDTTSKLKVQGFAVHVGPNVDRDHRVGSLPTSNCDLVEWSNLPESQESISFGFTRCTTLKSSDYANLDKGADLLKACSCSFCLKAAYMWSDLHDQDIKGRITEANILVNKFFKRNQSEVQDQVKSNKSLRTESDLKSQWRSLFHHMDGVFGHESSQLVKANFVVLRDLRENCKMNVERATGMPSDKT